MGFGTLFCGYFLLLNFAYSAFTDAISAVLMLYALYKLSSINREFKRAAYVSVFFLLFGVTELIIKAAAMILSITEPPLLTSLTAIIRYATVAAVTYLTLSGIREVASEVKLYVLSDKATRSIWLTLILYSVNLVLEVIGLFEAASYVFNYVAVITVVLTLTLTVINLSVIYTAYMRICMPGENDLVERPSKFAFVNAFRRHEEEKRQEYADYKRQKQMQKKEKEGRKNQCKKK